MVAFLVMLIMCLGGIYLKLGKKIKDNEINFDGKLPRYKLYLSNVKDGVSVNTWWDDVEKNLNAAKQIQKLFGSKYFESPIEVAYVEGNHYSIYSNINLGLNIGKEIDKFMLKVISNG